MKTHLISFFLPKIWEWIMGLKKSGRSNLGSKILKFLKFCFFWMKKHYFVSRKALMIWNVLLLWLKQKQNQKQPNNKTNKQKKTTLFNFSASQRVKDMEPRWKSAHLLGSLQVVQAAGLGLSGLWAVLEARAWGGQFMGLSNFQVPRWLPNKQSGGRLAWADWEWDRLSLGFLPTSDLQSTLNFGWTHKFCQ